MRAAVLLTLLVLVGCAKEDNNCTPGSEFYTFRMYKSLDTSANQVSVVNGNHMVFDYRYNYQQCPGVVGAAVTRDIFFEVATDTPDEFSYSGEGLSGANAMAYLVAPIYPALRLRRLVQGTIHGTRVSSSKWHIIASLNTGTEIINLDRDFLRTE